MRLGDWKLVAADGENWQLCNAAGDRTESKDLVNEQPAKMAELKSLYEDWAKRCGVQPWPIRQ